MTEFQTIEFFAADGHLRSLNDIEADIISLAVTHHGGCLAEAARRLRISRSTLYRKLDRCADLCRHASEAERRSLIK
jgi:DNA-binding NtrC family response regulator